MIYLTSSAEFSHIKVDGNNYADAGILCSDTSDAFQIRNVEVTDCDDGIVLGEGGALLGGKVVTFRITSCDTYGLVISDGATDFEIYDGLISSSDHAMNAGAYIAGGGGTKISQIHFWGAVNAIQFDSASRIYFGTCAINDATQHGIVFVGATYDVVFVGCEFRENGDSANDTYSDFYVNNGITASRIAITGCLFFGGTSSATWTKYAIDIDAGTDDKWAVGFNVVVASTFGQPTDLFHNLDDADNKVDHNVGV